ncbi:hypothetical protein ACP275_14G184200 [Erythranthe tilingii]
MGHSTTTESEDGVLSADSPLSNDGENSGGSSNGHALLKKGPWTTAEDSILVDYVKRHGEGNWNAVQKHSGLSRCGKSCRLRWANHLRPNLKKGAFTSEEERLIIELHAKMGNKWARMAAHLPGRTDNEIKNYWNTRIKRRQRAGLPLYPPDLCLHALSENQHLGSPGIYDGDKGCHDIMQINGYETPDFMFDNFNISPYTSEFPGISATVSTSNGFAPPQFCTFAPQIPKCAQETDAPMPDYEGGSPIEAPPFHKNQIESYASKMSQSFGLYFPYEPDPTRKMFPFGVDKDSHFMSNGISSASEHFTCNQKSELPSLQYQESGFGAWDSTPESFDSLVQSPMLGPSSSHWPSPGSSGLLEDLLYEAKALSKSENQSCDWATSSNISHGDVKDSPALENGSAGFNDYRGHPSSPSGNSIGSIFNGYTSAGTFRSSLEENKSVRRVKSEVFDQSWILDCESKKNPNNYLDYSTPEASLGSYWVEQNASYWKQQGCPPTDAIGALMGEDTKNTSASIWGLSSCCWNNMPAVCQMSDIH